MEDIYNDIKSFNIPNENKNHLNESNESIDTYKNNNLFNIRNENNSNNINHIQTRRSKYKPIIRGKYQMRNPNFKLKCIEDDSFAVENNIPKKALNRWKVRLERKEGSCYFKLININ